MQVIRSHGQRARYSFLPDQEWQQTEKGRHYVQSARSDTYLGVCHTHPNAACSNLSCKDRARLKARLEKNSIDVIPCQASGKDADVSDDDPRFGRSD